MSFLNEIFGFYFWKIKSSEIFNFLGDSSVVPRCNLSDSDHIYEVEDLYLFFFNLVLSYGKILIYDDNNEEGNVFFIWCMC